MIKSSRWVVLKVGRAGRAARASCRHVRHACHAAHDLRCCGTEHDEPARNEPDSAPNRKRPLFDRSPRAPRVRLHLDVLGDACGRRGTLAGSTGTLAQMVDGGGREEPQPCGWKLLGLLVIHNASHGPSWRPRRLKGARSPLLGLASPGRLHGEW